MPMSDAFHPLPGHVQQIAPMVRRIVAPNPSPMTFRGTNTYLLGEHDIAVIDPGPPIDTHLAALQAAIAPHQRISHILVTHSHKDHSPLAHPLAAATDAPVLGFGSAMAGRSDTMRALANTGFLGGGEGVDEDFVPDIVVADGDRVTAEGWTLEVMHTPGHMGNHICLAWQDHCFVGDHVMGWASSLVSPPDGDLTDFMTSCARLNAREWHRFYPGHGDIITAPNARLHWLIEHRLARETAILSALQAGPLSATALTRLVYQDIPDHMWPAAERNIIAHLIDLLGKSRVVSAGQFDTRAVFSLADSTDA